MKKYPKISEAEWEVMKVIWDRHPITANEVVEKLSPDFAWKPETVKTMVKRLHRKGALGYRLESKHYLYYPRVTQDECIQRESRSFLNRICNGAVGPMLVHFAEAGELDPNKIEKLKELLEEGDQSV